MGFYKTRHEKLADIITANANPLVAFRPGLDGKQVLAVLDERDLQLAKEKQAAAISRLAIDKAMVAGKGE